jgi:hypothetical protein
MVQSPRERAEYCVAAALRIVTKQRRLIENLKGNSHLNTETQEKLLVLFEKSLATFEGDLARITAN